MPKARQEKLAGRVAHSGTPTDAALARRADELHDRSRATEILALISSRRIEHDEQLRSLVTALDRHRDRVAELERERAELLAEIEDLRTRNRDAQIQVEALSGPRPHTQLRDLGHRARDVGALLRKALS